YEAHIAEAARRFRLPPTWIRAVLGAESAGDQRATSRKGAMGLMQIVPNTWSDLRVRYHLGADPYDPHDNIIAGSAYIRELVDRYGSPGWIAAYNAGPGRYEASLQGRWLPRET
ncbi:lytic transglycosylase domain-containing protein, partial [Mesorhizobium sp. M2D.F.Ca.ET.160.01.1.1]